MISAILTASVICDHLVLLFRTDRRLFIVLSRRSIMLVALWLLAGANIKIILLSLQNSLNCLDLNACA